MATQPAGYAELVAARGPALLRLALMLTGELADAEDLVQTTLLRVHRHAERITAMTAPAAYLRRALVNEHHSFHRTLRRRVTTMPLRAEHDPPAAHDTAGTLDERDATWQLLATLPRRQRSVLVLRYYEDLDDREIADVLGCGVSTVRSQASRALATLRAHLTETEVHR